MLYSKRSGDGPLTERTAMDEFDMVQEERLWPTVEEPETWEEAEGIETAEGEYGESGGEDYGVFGGEGY